MAEGPNHSAERPRALERVAEALERRPAAERAAQPSAEAPPPVAGAPIIPAVQPVTPPKTPLREDIEAALADGLERIYAELPPDRQATFRRAGEQLAGKLETMLAGGKFVLRTVHRWIVDWLRLLPRRSKSFAYFLIQEAKVKTDSMLALRARK